MTKQTKIETVVILGLGLSVVLGIWYMNNQQISECRYDDFDINRVHYTQSLVDDGFSLEEASVTTDKLIEKYYALPLCTEACHEKLTTNSKARVEFYLDDYNNEIPCEEWLRGDLERNIEER